MSETKFTERTCDHCHCTKRHTTFPLLVPAGGIPFAGWQRLIDAGTTTAKDFCSSHCVVEWFTHEMERID